MNSTEISLSNTPDSCLSSSSFSCLAHMQVQNQVFPQTQLGFFWNTCPIIQQVFTVSSDHTCNSLQQYGQCNASQQYGLKPNRNSLQQYGQKVWHYNLRPMRQCLFRSNSNNFESNSAKHNFACLTNEYICDLVLSQGLPLTYPFLWLLLIVILDCCSINFTSFSLVDHQYQITNHCYLVYFITGEATLRVPQYSHYSKGNKNQPGTNKERNVCAIPV